MRNHHNTRLTRKPVADDETSPSGLVLGLSLFIMLLAFFIVLNAISSFEESKYKPIMESIEEAFSTRIFTAGLPVKGASETQESSMFEGHTFKRLKALFAAEIPSFKVAMKNRGELMIIRVREDHFSRAVMSIGQQDPRNSAYQRSGGFFVPLLVDILNNKNPESSYEVSIMLNLDDNPAELSAEKPGRMASVARRISMLAEQLVKAGMPGSLLSIGTHKGKQGFVDLYFRSRQPYDAVSGVALGEEEDG